MLKTLAIRNYRSLLDVVIPLGQLNVVTGANGSGKSNLYRALHLLAETTRSGVVGALAAEGGLPSTFWAGPDHKSMKPATTRGVIEGGRRSEVKRLSLGFASEDFGYAISLGHNPPVPMGKFWPPSQSGLLRPLSVTELSEGTLLYLLWVAALLTPRPPPLMVLNEPETSLHTDLLPALARLIGQASEVTQIWVITHSPLLAAELATHEAHCPIRLEKHLGQTLVNGQTLLEAPPWRWPDPKS